VSGCASVRVCERVEMAGRKTKKRMTGGCALGINRATCTAHPTFSSHRFSSSSRLIITSSLLIITSPRLTSLIPLIRHRPLERSNTRRLVRLHADPVPQYSCIAVIVTNPHLGCGAAEAESDAIPCRVVGPFARCQMRGPFRREYRGAVGTSSGSRNIEWQSEY
jgi:hypothetical protein